MHFYLLLFFFLLFFLDKANGEKRIFLRTFFCRNKILSHRPFYNFFFFHSLAWKIVNGWGNARENFGGSVQARFGKRKREKGSRWGREKNQKKRWKTLQKECVPTLEVVKTLIAPTSYRRFIPLAVFHPFYFQTIPFQTGKLWGMESKKLSRFRIFEKPRRRENGFATRRLRMGGKHLLTYFLREKVFLLPTQKPTWISLEMLLWKNRTFFILVFFPSLSLFFFFFFLFLRLTFLIFLGVGNNGGPFDFSSEKC